MSTMLALHIAGATTALIAGTGAAILSKGSPMHRTTGRAFVVAMLVMGIAAMPVAWDADKIMDVFGGLMVCYLVLSAVATFRPWPARATAILAVLAACTAVGYAGVEWHAIESGVRRPDVPPGAALVFAFILALAVTGDVRLLRGRILSRKELLIRHLWRMCFAFLLATASFFLARAHLFPDLVREAGLHLAGAIAPLFVMAFWWLRLRWSSITGFFELTPTLIWRGQRR